MSELLADFHFAQPWWLLALLIPLLVALWLRISVSRARQAHLERYADPKLLPHLVSQPGETQSQQRRRMGRWSIIWVLAILAMAGPRWDYADTRLFRPGTDLLVLLDLSRSMEANDVRPSRLGRARQEIEDLLAQNAHVRVGLIAFASVAHVVAPVTEDRETITRMLPAMSTDLVRMQGSRVSNALYRAERLLMSQNDENAPAILLVTDGDFAEPELLKHVERLAARGIIVHVLGIGTPEGAGVPGADGRPLTDMRGVPVVSKLDESMLENIARAGGGIYQRADYRDNDIRAVLEQLTAGATVQADDEREVRIWHERFYLLAIIAMLLILPWFRKMRPAQGPAQAGGNA